MRWLGRLTIGQKLRSLSVLSSMTALLSASVVFFVYDAYTLRAAMAGRILTDARIVAFNSISPLIFHDAETATATLQGLQADPAVQGAVIFSSPGGEAFARYARGGGRGELEAVPHLVGQRFAGGHLLVSEPIRFEGRLLGTLVIKADLRELHDRQRRYGGIVMAVLVTSFLLAVSISRLVEKTLSRPILHLVDTARAVSSGGDYSVRAEAGASDEVGLLSSTFNEMLERIERQNLDLEAGRADLEKRVAARTQDLAAANRELEAFSYSVSHDLRAPLRAIDGFSKALLGGYADKLDERGRHFLDRVRAGTQRMSGLIDDLLGLARLSRRELVRRPVDVTTLAQNVAGDLAKNAREGAVRFEVAQGLSAQCDAQLVTIVLENLMGNAWKFTSKLEQACIEVGRSNGPDSAFYVRDNGAGFDMTYADKLFGPFQRLHSDSDFEGTGIGLATVHRIVTRHGGRIWAEGHVGQGATFYFTLERQS